MILIIAIGGGYWHAYSLRGKVTDVWKRTLWEDCTNRMSESNVKKIQTFSSTISSDIKIEDERQTLHVKKDSTESLTADEGDFLADQYYLSQKNPVKIEKLDSLFRIKLKENGCNFKTAVSFYDNETAQKTFYGQEDVKILHDYLRLTYKVDIRDVILLEGYVKGGWLENLLWGKGFYILLSLIFFGALVLLVLEKRRLRFLMQFVRENQLIRETPLVLPIEFVQDAELATEPVEEHTQPELNLQPTVLDIFLDEEKHTLVYTDKEILLAPKVFDLFYQLAQGKDCFQSYELLYQSLWSNAGSADKKHLEQLVIRLREKLKDIPQLRIETIRGSGYQIKGENDIKINIEQIDHNNE